ncbi:MAG: lytic transglycosylase domain-containing protein [Alphaproteobacteria bacterium]|nr:lytic transglycosylase domain-containing protein [Alphaproteobacteria bacterium]
MKMGLAAGLGILALGAAAPSPEDLSILALGGPRAPALSEQDQVLYRAAFQAAEDQDWDSSQSLSAQADDQALASVLMWMRYLEADGGGTFAEISAFIQTHEDWPLPVTLKVRVEAAMEPDLAPETVLDWFERFPAVTGQGMVRLAQAHQSLGHSDDANAWAVRAWTTTRLGAGSEAELLDLFGEVLSLADHQARLDDLIWDGNAAGARRVVPHVDDDTAALGRARIALMLRLGGVDTAIAAVPDQMLGAPGLVFERVRWRRRAGNTEDAIALLIPAPSELGRPAPWWTERNILARRSLDLGHVTDAYQLTRDHGQTSRANVAAAEWLAGWIALTLLDDPASAYQHFTREHAAVRFPVSLARGAYWAGRAATEMDEDAIARSWYAEAARYQTTYYGQLAAEVLGSGFMGMARPKLKLPDDPVPTQGDLDHFTDRALVPIIQLLAQIDEQQRLSPFILSLSSRATTPGERQLVAALAVTSGRPDLGVSVAKRAIQDGLVLATASYPRPNPASDLEPALVLAVARQESEFNQLAISSAGARGLMQLMPATAQVVARAEQMPFDRDRLTADPAYNMALGSAHLADLVAQFDGSYVLAVAAYNAGASRVRGWLRAYGDPRSRGVDVINWIEAIPFPETRNYVQRVLENLQVYRSVLANRPTPITLRLDLNR